MTRLPAARRSRTSCEPINPAPPVTITVSRTERHTPSKQSVGKEIPIERRRALPGVGRAAGICEMVLPELNDASCEGCGRGWCHRPDSVASNNEGCTVAWCVRRNDWNTCRHGLGDDAWEPFAL